MSKRKGVIASTFPQDAANTTLPGYNHYKLLDVVMDGSWYARDGISSDEGGAMLTRIKLLGLRSTTGQLHQIYHTGVLAKEAWSNSLRSP